jgi:alpha-N-arabinofuranosidase
MPSPHRPPQHRSSLLRACALALLIATATSAARAQSGSAAAQLNIDAAHIVSPVSPTLYGLMTEEINHSYDGGLYAEMIQNRAFHADWEGEPPWDLVRRGNAAASRELDTASGPSQALSYSMKLTVSYASAGNEAGLTNPGYWGYGLRPNTTYSGSLYARIDSGDIGPIAVRMISNSTGAVLAQTEVTVKPGPWARYEYQLTTRAIQSSIANHLELTVAHPGTLWLQLVSLMPPTYHNRPNGNRPDLMERMAAMHPTFLRLPGGNYLEGMTPADRFDWKKTIGPLVDRPGHQGPWFYWSSDGLGLLEFLEWCEDLKVEPVLAIYAGYSLGGTHIATGKDLEPYVESALDEIEYVTGDASTGWGAERARDGHPAPFQLHYIEIGNEDYLDRSGSYPARYAQFAEALRKRYPQFKLISTDGNSEYQTKVNSDVSDEHYYKSPADMMDLVHHYDNMPRTGGPKIFVGEWATRSGSPTPNFGDALGDAAWMTSMERNSDLIVMASYAPLLVNVSPGGMEWPTDLIGFDAGTTYASPSYWAQALFASHLGDGTAQSSITGENKRFFYSATVSSADQVLHLKLVNASNIAQPLSIQLAGAKGHGARMISLHGATFQATNSIHDPNAIRPVESTVSVSGSPWQHTVPALTIEVIDVPLR